MAMQVTGQLHIHDHYVRTLVPEADIKGMDK